MQLSRFSKRWRVAGSSLAAVILASVATLYLLSEPAESAPPAASFHECKTLHCGPLRLADCGSATDGPLLVFSRLPNRYLGDCGYWNGGPGGLLCSTVYGIKDSCTLSATPNSALLTDAYYSPLRAQRGAAKRER